MSTIVAKEKLPVTGSRSLDEAARRISIEYQNTRISINESIEQSSADGKLPDYHSIPLEDFYTRYQTSADGLAAEDAASRLNKNGPNVLAPPAENVGLKILGYLFGGFGPILWGASLLCFIAWRPLGDPNPDRNNLILALVLIGVILIQAAFNAYQDFTSNKVMNSIKKLLPSVATGIREGAQVQIQTSTIVPGDVVSVTLGNKIPADVRWIQVNKLKLDTSPLTGESEPVTAATSSTSKNYVESKNVGFMGTAVVQGSGIGVVVNTGNKTVMGQIAKTVAKPKVELSHLQREIRRFVLTVCSLAFSIAVIIVIVWAAWLRTSYPGFMPPSALLLNIIGSVVAFIPEGLPVAVTLVLTLIAKRMFKQAVLVKHLPTVETLGSVDTICSDKTGTLTQNKMTVVDFSIGTTVYPSCVTVDFTQKKSWQDLALIGSLCNKAVYDKSNPNAPEPVVIGDSTDTGILNFCNTFISVEEMREKYPEVAGIPFNSKNKWALTINKVDDKDAMICMKGAAEFMIDRCPTYMNKNGEEKEFTEKKKTKLKKQQEEKGGQGKRVLGLCKKTVSASEYDIYDEEFDIDVAEQTLPLNSMCFVGLMALMDPPRPQVVDVIADCKTAGIRVSMVTGDHPSTSLAIARMVGIVTKDKVHTFADMKDDPNYIELTKLVPEIKKSKKCSLFMKKKKREQRDLERAEIQTPDEGEIELGAFTSKDDNALVLQGSDLSSELMNSHAWNWCIEYHSQIVFARTTPDQKLRIVKEFKKRGHLVAVTGDGVNDAPALKEAQAGVAMGSGSDVAIQAADIVLLDSNFRSLLVGIKNGRLVFENLRKVIIYLLPAGSWSELLPILVNVFLGIPLPLSAFLMIYICVITDILPSLSLMYEKAESNLMKNPPRNPKKDKMVNSRLFLHAYLFLGMIESFGAFFMYFYYMDSMHGIKAGDLFLAFDKWTDGYLGRTQDQLNEALAGAQTAYFIGLTFIQFGNLMSTRTRVLSFFQHDPFSAKSRNLWLFGGITGSLAFILILIEIPIFQQVFSVRNIEYQFWLMPLAFAVLLFGLDEIRKLIIRRHPAVLSCFN